MGKITLQIPDDVERDLRILASVNGYKRGQLSRVVVEALKDYISRHTIISNNKDEITFNINQLEKNKFYLVEINGEKFALRVTDDNRIQLYEVLE